MFGAQGGRVPALLGVSAAIVGGFTGFALRATNTILPATTTLVQAVQPLPYYECPGFAAPAGAFHTGDRVFAVAQDSTSTWLEVRAETDLTSLVWVQKEGVTLDHATLLPVAACTAFGGTQVLSTPGATPTPATSATPSPHATPTTAPTATPGATPTPTGPPSPPAFGTSSAHPTSIYEYYPPFGGLCVTQVTSAITVIVTGATSVTMAWTVATAPSHDGSIAMTHNGATWTATLGKTGTTYLFDQNTLGMSDPHEPITITFSAVGAGGTRGGNGPTITLNNASACGG